MTGYRTYDTWRCDDPADSDLGTCGDAADLNARDAYERRERLSVCRDCSEPLGLGEVGQCDPCAAHEAADQADIEAGQ